MNWLDELKTLMIFTATLVFWFAVVYLVFIGLVLILGAGLSEHAIKDVWLRP